MDVWIIVDDYMDVWIIVDDYMDVWIIVDDYMDIWIIVDDYMDEYGCIYIYIWIIVDYQQLIQYQLWKKSSKYPSNHEPSLGQYVGVDEFISCWKKSGKPTVCELENYHL